MAKLTEKYLKALRDLGVVEYRETEAGVSVRFGPPMPPVEPEPVRSEPNLRGIRAEAEAARAREDEEMTEASDLGLPAFPERPRNYRVPE